MLLRVTIFSKDGQTLTKVPVEKHEKWHRFGQTLLSADS